MKNSLKVWALTASMLFGAEMSAQAAPEADLGLAPGSQIEFICADTQKACTDFLRALAAPRNNIAMEEGMEEVIAHNLGGIAQENVPALIPSRDLSLSLSRQDRRVLPNGNTGFPSGPIITVRSEFAHGKNESIIQLTSPFEPDEERSVPIHDLLFTFSHPLTESNSETAVSAGAFGITNFDDLHLISFFLETVTKIRAQVGAWKFSTERSLDFLIGEERITYDGAMFTARGTRQREIFRAQGRIYLEIIALFPAQGAANLRYRSGVGLEIPTGETTSLSLGVEHNAPLTERGRVHPAATQGTAGLKIKL